MSHTIRLLDFNVVVAVNNCQNSKFKPGGGSGAPGSILSNVDATFVDDPKVPEWEDARLAGTWTRGCCTGWHLSFISNFIFFISFNLRISQSQGGGTGKHMSGQVIHVEFVNRILTTIKSIIIFTMTIIIEYFHHLDSAPQ